MPDATGRLTQQDNETIARWWTQHWKAPVVCPVCKTAEWSLASHVLVMNRHASDSLSPSGITYPHIAVGCKTCAHIMLFNAVAIGVVPPYREPAPLQPFNALLNPPSGPPPNPFNLPPIKQP